MDIVTEFIILTLKPNTPLEDPATEAGKVFLKAIYDIKSVHGYRSASWGRSLEDENVVVWAIDWKNHSARAPLAALATLRPFLAPEPLTHHFHTTLSTPLSKLIHPPPPGTASPAGGGTPTLSRTNTATGTPRTGTPTPEEAAGDAALPLSGPFAAASPFTTELWGATFAGPLSVPDKAVVETMLTRFADTLTAAPADEVPGPASYATGWISGVGHDGTPSGIADVCLLAAQWGNKDDHMQARNSKVFGEAITPVRARVTSTANGFGMRHVRFLKLA